MREISEDTTQNVVEVRKKELKPQDEKWQKELAAAGFDPRIRR